ncbi:heme A synthase [Sphingomonas cavernae]|uniref:Heme A synthase n=1 Tax=Sphingomonas cavernae TaxID=2320861 RepID=A0A418WNE2_9SPHN|nr:heme A synthase [Sphingomonas cavernae]
MARWLACVAALVFMIVVVGGVTRLTESGLSITEWKPISGTIPPLTHEAWQAEFDAYKRIPEYQEINRGMSLSEFKQIFFWEYIHRLLGRIIGLAFALPMLWFWWKRAIPKGYGPRLTALLALGGFQGAIGWWMVSSGLVERTDVSHIRLAVHLLTAFTILGGLTWTGLDLAALARNPQARPARLTGFAAFALTVLFLQLLLGAFTAGLNAGFAFSSWPKMGEEWFPAATPMLDPWLRNLVDNPIVVQFVHRWFAWITGAVLIVLGLRCRKAGMSAAMANLTMLVVVQIALGIATLLTGVNIMVATAHQAVGALLVISATAAAFTLGRRTG